MPFEHSELQTTLNINTHIISSEQRKIKVILLYFRPGFSSQMSTTATQLEHIINRVKHDTTCNLKPPFWINYSLCKYVPLMTQRLAHIQNKNNPVLCSRGCGPERVFTSLPMPSPPAPRQSHHWVWLWMPACSLLACSKVQLVLTTQNNVARTCWCWTCVCFWFHSIALCDVFNPSHPFHVKEKSAPSILQYFEHVQCFPVGLLWQSHGLFC